MSRQFHSRPKATSHPHPAPISAANVQEQGERILTEFLEHSFTPISRISLPEALCTGHHLQPGDIQRLSHCLREDASAV